MFKNLTADGRDKVAIHSVVRNNRTDSYSIFDHRFKKSVKQSIYHKKMIYSCKKLQKMQQLVHEKSKKLYSDPIGVW